MKLWAGLLGRADVWQFCSAGSMRRSGCWRRCRRLTFLSPNRRTPWRRTTKPSSCSKTSVPHTHTHVRHLFPLTWRRGFWRSLLFVRTASLLQEREEEIRSLNSDLQKKNGEISGWFSVNFTVTDKCVYPKYGKGPFSPEIRSQDSSFIRDVRKSV